MTISITQLTEHIGARVAGVDLTSPIDNETAEAVLSALYSHSVLVFHGQPITDDQHVVFTESLGPLQMTMVNDPYGERRRERRSDPPLGQSIALPGGEHPLALGRCV